MAWKSIQNISLIVSVDERVTLPKTAIAIDIEPDGSSSSIETVNINTWRNNKNQVVTTADTSKKGEFMYYGDVTGYPHPVYLSLIVGHNEENPKSKFPKEFMVIKEEDRADEFGIPKVEVRTADMPNIDDYQALKSKKNKTTFESAQEQKLTELLSAKIIKAEDINMLRNALINTQQFCLSLVTPFNLTYTDIENVGNGEGRVYADSISNDDSFGKIASFRSLKAGNNVSINQDGDNIIINAEVPPPEAGEQSPDFCSLNQPVTAKSFATCGLVHSENSHPMAGGSYYKFADFLGFKTIQVANNPNFKSIMHVFGSGDGLDRGMVNAGRIIKGARDFIIEIKTGNNTYSGIQICGNHNQDGNTGKVILYENDRQSHIACALAQDEVTVDSNGHATVDGSWTAPFVYSNMSGCGTI